MGTPRVAQTPETRKPPVAFGNAFEWAREKLAEKEAPDV